MAKLALSEEAQMKWLVPLIGRVKDPKWRWAGVQITWPDLNFKANGWYTIICSRILPTKGKYWISLKRTVMIGCIVEGIKMNLGAEMLRTMMEVARSDGYDFPYPNTLTAYLIDEGCNTRADDNYSFPQDKFDLYTIVDKKYPVHPVPYSTTPSGRPPTSRAPPPQQNPYKNITKKQFAELVNAVEVNAKEIESNKKALKKMNKAI